ncbi:MAG TPA: type III secretion protein HrpB4 [Trinickia sp.]|jgi:hypothetical protein|nr:type III secretion protein HrpB4 [Trinickia sp.]
MNRHDDTYTGDAQDQSGGEGAPHSRCADATVECAMDATDNPAPLAARLIEYSRRRRSLFDWMHPSRLARLPYADRVRGSEGAGAAKLAEAFLDETGMPVPPLSAFSAPGAALALLPMRDCLAVFRLRALLDYADEVHSWIDRPRRSLLTGWIGPHGARLLLARKRELTGDPARAAQRRERLDSGSSDGLAWRGLRLFERECDWPSDGPLALAQLALPDESASGPPASPLGKAGWNPSLSIVSQLPDLFPEWSW